jgi:hypothetical protein
MQDAQANLLSHGQFAYCHMLDHVPIGMMHAETTISDSDFYDALR